MSTGMMKSTCWLAATLIAQQRPVSQDEKEGLESLRRVHRAMSRGCKSLPFSELPPCLNCPDEVMRYCVQYAVECDEFMAYTDGELSDVEISAEE